MGSTRNARSVVNIIGAWRFVGSCASGTVSAAAGSVGVHCDAPAGLFTSFHSYSRRLSRYPLSHWVGTLVHAPSSPLVTASTPIPVPPVLCHPRPCASLGQDSSSGPTRSALLAP